MKDSLIDKVAMGRRLRELRAMLSYTHHINANQDVLAKAAGIHRTGYNAAENGRGGISKEALCRIIEYYRRKKGIDVSLDWILLGIENESKDSDSKQKHIEIARLREENDRLKKTLDAQNALILRVSN